MRYYMEAKSLAPILNVSNIEESFNWFQKLGWSKNWEWGEPVTFGCVGSGSARFSSASTARGAEEKDQTAQPFR